ncbi:MAG: hypothetical protein AAGF60_14710 [Pseudomonadota bacterium]
MSEFLRVLALYYACDSAAALRPLTAAEVALCMGHYNAVKAHFAGETNVARYRAFKSWEAANGDIVAQLKR